MKALDISSLSLRHQKYVRDAIERSSQHKRPKKVEAAAFGLKFDSKIEADLAGYFDLEKRIGSRDQEYIIEWYYHPMKFLLAPGLNYTPDFGLLIDNLCSTHFRLIEAKGSWKSKNARDSRTRLKIAAHLYPFFEWQAVTPGENGWEFEVIGENDGNGMQEG